MNNQLIPFNFESHTVRTMVLDETPWWVGKDVAVALGYKDSINAIKQHCRGVVKRHPIVDALGRTQQVRIIHEGDVWRLITNSHLPEAERFEKWLFETALPQIRRTRALVPEGMTLVNEAVFESTIQDLVAYSHLRAEVDAFKKALVPQIKDDREALEEIAQYHWAAGTVVSHPQVDLEQMKQDIAEIKGYQSLARYLIDKNEKLQRRGTRLSEDERRDIWFKYRFGMKVAQIERETGRDASSIRRIIKRGGGYERHPQRPRQGH